MSVRVQLNPLGVSNQFRVNEYWQGLIEERTVKASSHCVGGRMIMGTKG